MGKVVVGYEAIHVDATRTMAVRRRHSGRDWISLDGTTGGVEEIATMPSEVLQVLLSDTRPRRAASTASTPS
jgi:hypothetical protein